MPDTSIKTETERAQTVQRRGKGPCEACDADYCEFD